MKDYREKEMKQLLGVLLLLCIYYCTPVFEIISKSSSFFNEFVTMVKYIISLGVISLCVFLFDCLISSEMKNKLVGLFCIPMAGEVIFTKISENKIKDKRFTNKEARKRYDDIILNLPPNTQEKRNYENACWFSIYQKYKSDGAVVQSQKDFLTCRDLFSEIVLFAIMYLISIMLFKSFIIFSWKFIFILVALGTVINCSTHVKMNRFVNSVIAIDIAKGEKYNMAYTMTFYPLGNAETCLLELENGNNVLFDYAAEFTGEEDDERYDIKEELKRVDKFSVVMFSHAHDDHTKGASEFFYLEHAKKYQSDERKKIEELWVSAAFLNDTDLENGSDAKIIREEARYRLKNKSGVKIFAEPDSLNDWLEKEKIEYDDVSDLIVHAGTIIEDEETFGENVQIFVHAPFSNDSEEVQDKNDPSIVLQVRFKNGERNTNVLITGDTSYKVLDKIVDISKENENEDRLSWDIYDIPHHCSHTGLNEKEDDKVEPTENIKWLLSQAERSAIMIASCKKITKETSPPHLIAKEAYEKYTKDDVKFYATMEHLNSGKPTPIVLQIDHLGFTVKQNDEKKDYFKSYAPRAGR